VSGHGTSNRRRARGLACALALSAIAFSAARADAADSNVSAGFESTTGLLGEPLVFKIEVEDAHDTPAPPELKIPGFEVRFTNNEATSSSQSIRIVNGVRTEESHSTIVYRYEVTPSRPGDQVVEPFDFKLDGSTYHFEGGVIHVTRQAPGNQFAALRVTTDRPFYYPGQSVKLRVEIQLARSLASTPALDLPGFDGVTGVLAPNLVPPPGNEPVAVNVNGKEAVPFAREVRTDENGKQALVLSFVRELTPLGEGHYDLGSARLRAVIATRTERGFFGDAVAAETMRVVLSSPPLTLDVRPLPSEGRPACFSGAVGRFSLHVDVSPLTAKVGDPVTLTMRIAGEGSLGTASAPALAVDGGWKAYDSRSEADPEPHYGQGPAWKTFYRTLVPRTAGDLGIPRAKFGYFDPEAGKFVTLEGPAFTAKVTAGSVESTGVTGPSEPGPADGVRVVGRDIFPPIVDAGRLVKTTASTTLLTWLLTAFAVPPFFFGLALLTTRRRERHRCDPRRRAFADASRGVERALGHAKAGIDTADARPFHEAVAAALSSYVGAKLGVPALAVEPAGARRELVAVGVDPATAAELAGLLEVCDLGRFAALSVAPSERRATLDRARAVVRGVERRARFRLPAAKVLAGALGLAALLFTTPARAADAPAPTDPVALFAKAADTYRQGEAATAPGEKASRYREAAQLYEGLASSGYACGPVELDLGNCEQRLGHRGAAILAYLRARRELPRDADVRANLAFAREGLVALASEPEAPELAQSLLFPHFALTEAEEGVLALALWILAFVALGAGVVTKGKMFRRGGIVLLVAAATLGASVAVRIVSDRWHPLAVTLTQVTLRSAPEGGAPLATVPEGATVRIEESGRTFVKVRTPSGERGYAPRRTVETVMELSLERR
jgi:hypothetical protein